MIVTHFDLDHGALCGEDQPDSSGLVATSIREDQVDCEECLSALGSRDVRANFALTACELVAQEVRTGYARPV